MLSVCDSVECHKYPFFLTFVLEVPSHQHQRVLAYTVDCDLTLIVTGQTLRAYLSVVLLENVKSPGGVLA